MWVRTNRIQRRHNWGGDPTGKPYRLTSKWHRLYTPANPVDQRVRSTCGTLDISMTDAEFKDDSPVWFTRTGYRVVPNTMCRNCENLPE